MPEAAHPCRCLWRGLVQITYTFPWRRTILQFSHIRLTLDRTFMVRYFNRFEIESFVLSGAPTEEDQQSSYSRTRIAEAEAEFS